MASISANGSNGHHKFTLTVTESFVSDGAANYSTVKWDLKLSSLGGGYNWSYSSTVPVTWSVTINGTTYKGNIMSYDGSSTKTVGSGSLKVTHNSDGSKSIGYSFSVSSISAYYLPGSAKASGTMTLTKIGRGATATKATNFNDTGNPVLTYSNPAGSSASSLQACISLTGAAADIPYRDISKSGTSYTFNLTEAERNTLRAATPNSNTLTVRFYVQTVISGTTFRNYTTATMTIVDGTPTFSAAYKDTNSTTTGITGNNQQIIRNQSTLQVAVTSLSAKKYATIKTVTCTLNGTTYNGTVSGTSCTFNIGKVNIASNVTAAVKVTDSRGNSASKNLSITVLDWVLPTAIVTTERENNFYDNTTINVDGSISSVDGKNTMTIKMRYKKQSEAWDEQTWYTMQDNVSQVFSLNKDFAWDVQVVITDLFGSTTYNLTVSRGMPIFYVDRLLNSVGFNCFPKYENSVEVDGVPINRSIMTRSLKAQITNLTVSDYAIIPLNLQDSIGSRLTATSDGGIKIGAGVSKILVSAKMALEGVTKAGNRHLRIIKNSYSADNTLGWAWDTLAVSDSEDIIVTPVLADVAENDVIYMTYWTQQSTDRIGGNDYGNRTSLTVEVVG